MKKDYLKYWRPVRQYVKVKHGLTEAELDVLIFLYSEKYFGHKDFNEYNAILTWDKHRWKKLRRDGWIDMYRDYNRSTMERAIYKLSRKANQVVKSVYDMLEGKDIPVGSKTNPMFKRNASYTDKVFRHFISNLTKETRRLQHRSRE